MNLKDITPDEIKIIILAAGVSIAGFFIFHQRNSDVSMPYVIKPEDSKTAAPVKKTRIIVDVSGAVWSPGVYTLDEGARVADVLEKAMLRPDADIDKVNRARLLYDGQKLVVPSNPPDNSGDISEEGKVLININTASLLELQALPYIGESRARDIVHYREKHGPFSSVGELENIAGIGPSTIEQLKEKAVVR
jgi:competence protein ComEA